MKAHSIILNYAHTTNALEELRKKVEDFITSKPMKVISVSHSIIEAHGSVYGTAIIIYS